MSYSQLIPFVDGKPSRGAEFRNAWGGPARIWDALFDRYLKDPNIPYHNWLGKNADALWPLAKRSDLPRFERAVHAFTFDRAYVRRDHFPLLVADLRAFVARYPVADRVDHLGAWADAIQALDAEAVGLYGTSVAENIWWEYDEDKDASIPYGLADGFEVYDWITTNNQPANE